MTDKHVIEGYIDSGAEVAQVLTWDGIEGDDLLFLYHDYEIVKSLDDSAPQNYMQKIRITIEEID